MTPRSERNRRRDQTARLPGRWRRLGPRRDRRPAGAPGSFSFPIDECPANHYGRSMATNTNTAGPDNQCREHGCARWCCDQDHTSATTDSMWLVTVDRQGFGWRYSASRIGVMYATGWLRSEATEDTVREQAYQIGRLAYNLARDAKAGQ